MARPRAAVPGTSPPTYAGTLIVTDSVITANTASSGSAGMGGGIHNWAGGTLAIHSSTLSNNAAYNSGGALYNNGSSATLTDCTVTGNVSNTGHGDSGGGGAIISVTAGAQLVVDGSTISGNTATTGAGGFQLVVPATPRGLARFPRGYPVQGQATPTKHGVGHRFPG